jgi:hypothetical protein
MIYVKIAIDETYTVSSDEFETMFDSDLDIVKEHYKEMFFEDMNHLATLATVEVEHDQDLLTDEMVADLESDDEYEGEVETLEDIADYENKRLDAQELAYDRRQRL